MSNQLSRIETTLGEVLRRLILVEAALTPSVEATTQRTQELDKGRLAVIADRASRANTLVPRRDGVESLSDFWFGEIAWLVDEVLRLAASPNRGT